MAILKGHKANFEMLLKAAKNNDLALMECMDVVTGKPVYAICLINREDGAVSMAPVAKLFDGNPYEELIPPVLEGEKS